MGHYRLHFYDRDGDLGAWHEVLQAHWWIDTFPSREKTLLNSCGSFCKDAIESIQFQIVYLDKKDNPKQYTTKIYCFEEEDDIWNAFQEIDERNEHTWDKFDNEFEKSLLKCLKATNRFPKENLHNLKTVLWNKMSDALIEEVKKKNQKEKKPSERFMYISTEVSSADNFSWGCNFDVDIKLPNKTLTVTFSLDAKESGFLGLHYWDVFDKVSIISPDLNINTKAMSLITYQKDFKEIFDKIENWIPFRRVLSEIFNNVATDWKRWYWENNSTKPESKFSKEAIAARMQEHLIAKNTLHWQYVFNEPFMTFDSTIWGTATLRIDFKKNKLEDVVEDWFKNHRVHCENNRVPFEKYLLGKYLLRHIYGTLTYKCSIPTNPDLIDCKVEEMGENDFLKEIEKRFCKNSQHMIKEELGKFLAELFWNDDFRLPPDTKDVLNDLGATKEQKAKVANEFEITIKADPCERNILAEHEENVRIALNELKKELQNFEVRGYCDTKAYPTSYYIACSFLNYYFVINLHMKDKLDVKSYNVRVEVLPMDRKYAVLNDSTIALNESNECCNSGRFLETMSKYFGNDEYKAIAFKRHILYTIESIYGLEIRWRD